MMSVVAQILKIDTRQYLTPATSEEVIDLTEGNRERLNGNNEIITMEVLAKTFETGLAK
jgi:hypothetical protein